MLFKGFSRDVTLANVYVKGKKCSRFVLVKRRQNDVKCLCCICMSFRHLELCFLSDGSCKFNHGHTENTIFENLQLLTNIVAQNEATFETIFA